MFGKHEGFHGKPFGLAHIVLLALTLFGTCLAVFLLRKSKHETIRKLYNGCLVFLVISHLAKWTWDYVMYRHFDLIGSLPMFICSITMFVIPLAVYGKGLWKRAALGHIATLNVIGAVGGVVFSTVIMRFPFYHFNVLNSFIYHGVLLFVGLIAWVTRYYRPKAGDLGLFFVPCVVMAVPVVVCNELFGWDYMFLHNGKDTPFAILSRAVPKPIYILIMMAGYYAVTLLSFYIPTVVRAARPYPSRPIQTPESLWVDEPESSSSPAPARRRAKQRARE